jgi:hypothetical protein
MSINVCTVLDAADIEHSVVDEGAERDSVIAAAGHPPPLELESQWLG